MDKMISVTMSEADWFVLRANLVLAAIDCRILADESVSENERESYFRQRKEMLKARTEIIHQVWPTNEDEKHDA